MFQIPSLALGINPRVWGWAVGQHVWNMPPTTPFPHDVKKKKNAFAVKITATICFSICGTRRSTICCTIRFDIQTSEITLITSTLYSSRICGTGTSTICSICARPPVLSPHASTSVPGDLTSKKPHDFFHEPQHEHIPRSAPRRDTAHGPAPSIVFCSFRVLFFSCFLLKQCTCQMSRKRAANHVRYQSLPKTTHSQKNSVTTAPKQ